VSVNTSQGDFLNSIALRRVVGFFAVSLGMSHAATPSDQAGLGATQKTVAKKSVSKKFSAKKTKAKNAVVTPIGQTDPGWGETPQQRANRLTHECRGKPNGGACEGFGGP
jgi:hypothetical protein